MASYEYTVEQPQDLAGAIDLIRMSNEIIADPGVTQNPTVLHQNDTSIFIEFASDLSAPEKTALDTVVANYSMVEQAKEQKQAAIKAEANRRIMTAGNPGEEGTFLNLPEWKQRNAIARSAELIEIQTIEQRALTPQEQGENDAIHGLWIVVKGIRAKSDELEIEVDSFTTMAEVEAYDETDNAKWI